MKPMTRGRMLSAFSVYAALALAAVLTLDGPIRLVTLVFLGAFAAKTWIAYLREPYP